MASLLNGINLIFHDGGQTLIFIGGRYEDPSSS